MPNSPDIQNRVLSIRVHRKLYCKIQREAERRGMDMSAFVRFVLMENTLNAELSASDVARIKKEVEHAKSLHH